MNDLDRIAADHAATSIGVTLHSSGKHWVALRLCKPHNAAPIYGKGETPGAAVADLLACLDRGHAHGFDATGLDIEPERKVIPPMGIDHSDAPKEFDLGDLLG